MNFELNILLEYLGAEIAPNLHEVFLNRFILNSSLSVESVVLVDKR